MMLKKYARLSFGCLLWVLFLCVMHAVASAETKTLPWQGNKLGESDEPFAPWTPVEVVGNSLKVWGRELRLSGDSILDQVKVLGNDLLDSPVRWSVRDSSGSVSPVRTELKWGTITKGSAEFVQYSFFKTFKLENTVRIEYDGYMTIVTQLIPANSSVRIEELTLDIPLKRSLTKFVSHYFTGWPPPMRPKDAFGTSNDYGAVPIPSQNWGSEFTPALWLGNEELGVGWFCESIAGWTMGNPQQVIEGVVQPQSVRMRIHFIDQPKLVSQAIKFSWGMVATPVKPFPEMATYLQSITAQAESSKDFLKKWLQPVPGGGTRLDDAVKDGLKAVLIHQRWTDFPGYPGVTKGSPEEGMLKQVVQEAHKRGLKVILYIGRDLPVDSPEGRTLFQEMVRMPLNERKRKGLRGYVSYNVDPNDLYNDFLVYKTKELIDTYRIDGIMLDGHNMVTPCLNEKHGHQWKKDGTPEPIYPIADTRELMKRLYWLFHEYKKDGLVIAHAETPYLPSLNFADLRWVGEGTVWRWRHQYQRLDDGSVLNVLPLDEFRAIDAGYNLGIPLFFLTKDRKVGPMISKERIASVCLLHGVLPRFRWPALFCPERCGNDDRVLEVVYEKWLALSKEPSGEWHFAPYWNLSGPFKFTGAYDAKVVLSAHYNDAQRNALFYISNFSAQDGTFVVESVRPGIKINKVSPITSTNCRVTTDHRLEVNLPRSQYAVVEIQY